MDEIYDTRPIEASKSVRLYMDSYPVIKHTACGVWIARGYLGKKFVNLGAYRKWAAPTKEEAMKSFVERKRRQVAILSHQLLIAEASLYLKAENACDLVQNMFRLEDPDEPH